MEDLNATRSRLELALKTLREHEAAAAAERCDTTLADQLAEAERSLVNVQADHEALREAHTATQETLLAAQAKCTRLSEDSAKALEELRLKLKSAEEATHVANRQLEELRVELKDSKEATEAAELKLKVVVVF